LTELKEDGFGTHPCYQCFVAECLVDGEPSKLFYSFPSHTFTGDSLDDKREDFLKYW